MLDSEKMETLAPQSILLVDDDANVSAGVEHILCKEGYVVKCAANIFQAEGCLLRHLPDLIILDRHLPDGDGAQFCMKLKRDEKYAPIPILFLSSKAEVTDRVLGLEVGGDAYLPKPFDNAELAAMVKAIIRRTLNAPSEALVIEVGALRLDLSARKCYLNKIELDLSSKDIDLLRAFMERPNRVLTRENLLQLAWGLDKELELLMKGVDVAVSRLRRKLGKCGEQISAVRGYGYRFDLPLDG
jgi:two-component system OmpR family response regulator